MAKAHKIGERLETKPSRVEDKDAHDACRIFVDVSTEELAGAPSSMRAGRAEEGIGEPATVSLQTSILAGGLVKALNTAKR